MSVVESRYSGMLWVVAFRVGPVVCRIERDRQRPRMLLFQIIQREFKREPIVVLEAA